MTVGKKLFLSFSALFSLLLVVSFFSLYSLSAMRERLETAVTKTTRRIILANDIDTAESNMLAWQRALAIYTMVKKPAEVERSRQKFTDALAGANKAVEQFRP